MSHRICPECGSNEHNYGYGFAVGRLGSYLLCLECGYHFADEFLPDNDADEFLPDNDKNKTAPLGKAHG